MIARLAFISRLTALGAFGDRVTDAGEVLTEPEAPPFCTSPCENGQQVNATLKAAACELFETCIDLASNDIVRSTFPSLSGEWCEIKLAQVKVVAFKEDEFSQVLDESFLHVHLGEPLGIIGAIQKGEKPAQWQECSTEGTCERCMYPGHRGGVATREVTSHPCVWNNDTQTCLKAAGNSISDPRVCSPRPTDDEKSSSLVEVRGGKKRALLVAFTYQGESAPLGGTIPDIVMAVQILLKQKDPGDIHVLTDAGGQVSQILNSEGWTGVKVTDTTQGSPKVMLQKLFQDSVTGLGDGDSFVFHYSGHGSFIRDQSGDELDGWDEILYLPLGEKILDDEFYEWLLEIPEGVEVSMVVDACHSEGFSDLPFSYRALTEDGIAQQRTWCTDWKIAKDLPTARITYIASAQNHQTAADQGSKGGAHTSYVFEMWGRATEVFQAFEWMWDGFQERGITQQASLFAFPTFRDTFLFCAWRPMGEHHGAWLVRNAAVGGPDGGRNMRVPSLCTHGEGEHQRDLQSRADKRLQPDSKLDGAEHPRPAGLVEGWQQEIYGLEAEGLVGGGKQNHYGLEAEGIFALMQSSNTFAREDW